MTNSDRKVLHGDAFEGKCIDSTSPMPFYHQLQRILEEELDRGRWEPGGLLPSESRLATLFGISRTVIRQAMDEMEKAGRVIRVKGKGTVVVEPRERLQAQAFASTVRGSNGGPLRLSAIIAVQEIRVGGPVGIILDLAPPEFVIELVVSHSVGGVTASVNTMILRRDASPEILAMTESGELLKLEADGPSLWAQLSTVHGVRFSTSDISIHGGIATKFDSELLGLPEESTIFLLSSLDRDSAGRPVAYSSDVVRADMFVLSMSLGVGSMGIEGSGAALQGLGTEPLKHPASNASRSRRSG